MNGTPIEELRGKLSNLVINKFVYAGLDTVDDIFNTSPEIFGEWPGVGEKAIRLLREFQEEYGVVHANGSRSAGLGIAPPSALLTPDDVATFGHIKVENIVNLVDRRVMLKLRKFEFQYLHQLANLTLPEFSRLPSVGSRVCDSLQEFIDQVREDPAPFLLEHERVSRGLTLPPALPEDASPVNLIMVAIDGYLNHNYTYGEIRDTYIIDQLHGLSDGEKINQLELSVDLDLSRERVRQLYHKFLPRLGAFLNGEADRELGIQLHPAVLIRLQAVSQHFRGLRIFNRRALREFIYIQDTTGHREEAQNYVDLFLKAIGFIRVPSTYASFHTERFMAVEMPRPHLRKAFAVGKKLIGILNDHALSLTAAQLFTQLSGVFPGLDKDTFLTQLRLYPDVEAVGDEEVTYQVAFPYLKSVCGMAKRILNEFGQPTHVDDITEALNHRLADEGLEKRYDREKVRHALMRNSNVCPIGKMSTYQLTKWGQNTDSITRLIRKALKNRGNPMSGREIVDVIVRQRPRLKEQSIFSILSMDYPRLLDNRFALPEWEQLYADELSRKRDHPPLRGLAIEKLQAHPYGMMALDQLKEYLLEQTGCSRTTLYQLFYQDAFEVTKLDGKDYVAVSPDYTPEPTREAQFREEVVAFMQQYPFRRCTVKHFVRYLNSRVYKPNTLRRKITDNADLLRKVVVDGRAYVVYTPSA